ncbi:hypothetical protein NDU88_000483 [Pleurodeles waltl]|uniref:Uncharacterized protein n=1 Tax=Pleurodeles waltl TaxID=8319 RepID=A0AAV7LD70_PLEWA|nr:hypothetical protein NDU88_000483 [Pleurodeles waltl]
MAEENVCKALALLEPAGRLDLLRPEALAPEHPERQASAGVAAVLACSPPRATSSAMQVRKGARAAGGPGRRGAAWAGPGEAGIWGRASREAQEGGMRFSAA